MFYTLWILFCLVIPNVYAMKIVKQRSSLTVQYKGITYTKQDDDMYSNNTAENEEIKKLLKVENDKREISTIVKDILTESEPISQGDALYFFRKTKQVIEKIDNFYTYTRYISTPLKKCFVTVIPQRLPSPQNSNFMRIYSIMANIYTIYLTPHESLNKKFLETVSNLIAKNEIVFKDEQEEIRVRDIIFNVGILLTSPLDEPSELPRFKIVMCNDFKSNSIPSARAYQRTKKYTEQLILFFYKKFFKLGLHTSKGSAYEPHYAFKITDWMWVRQGDMQEKDRKLYGDSAIGFAFLNLNTTKEKASYAINGAAIIEKAKKEILLAGQDNFKKSIQKNFENLSLAVRSVLSDCNPYQKENMMFFSEPSLSQRVIFGNIQYFQRSNRPFKGLFNYISGKIDANKSELTQEQINIIQSQKEAIFSVQTNCYNIYLMPIKKNKQSIFFLLLRLAKENPIIYKDNDGENVHFNDILFNIVVNLDESEYNTKPIFVLQISNSNTDVLPKSMGGMVSEQAVAATKKYTEELLKFLYSIFKAKNLLKTNEIIPAASQKIKDLFFVSQGEYEYFLKRDSKTFDNDTNFAYFNNNVTGRYVDYIIKPEELFPEENISLHPVASQALQKLGQSIPSASGSPSNNQTFWSSIGTILSDWIRWFFSLLIPSWY